MASVQKYAALPDLDPAPDIYETPELTDDASTLQTSAAHRSDSAASSFYDPDEDEVNGIDRHRLDPDEARTHFLPSQADRRDSKFPDRIASKRKSYQTSSRRRRKDSRGGNEIENSSDEDNESLERKFARLQREFAEVKAEYDRRRSLKEDDMQLAPQAGEDALDVLSRVLDDVNTSIIDGSNGAASRLVKKLGAAASTHDVSKDSALTEPQQVQGKSTYTITYAPSYQQNHVLTKVADFDTRLAMVETVLGIDTIPLAIQDVSHSRAIIPTLDDLDKQISTLSSSTDSSLDLINRRVRQLTQDAEKLDEARRSAKAAQEELTTSSSSRLRHAMIASGELKETSSIAAAEDSEQISRINALYGTLPTIESLAPLLPSVLDRLRSLRLIHADAATASEDLRKVEVRQEAMVEELKGWREGLEKLEKAMKDGEATVNGNTKVVEVWVKELEDRMQKLDL